MTNHDRRAQPRVEWTGEAVAAFGDREVRLRTCDLSIGGCSVETPWCPRTGERVGIVLQLDGDPIGAWAEVAWASRRSGASDERYRWGLRFLELEQDCRARLGAFVDHCLAVDMLDEMLRGARDEAPRPVPAFGPGEFDDIPTRIFQHGQEVLPGRTFFPVEGAGAFDAESTAEIDVEATLTSEVPHTRTVQVDIADLYADAATVEAAPRAAMMVAAQDQDPWGRSGPEPIAFDGGWDAPSVASSMGWDDVGTPAAEFVIEPLAAEPSRPAPAARRPTPAPIADAGDPFWSGATSAFPARTPSIWPSPPAAPVEPFAGTPTHDPNAYAKAAPFDGPGMDAIAMPADDDAYGFQASFEHAPVTTTRPAFDAPAFDAPAFDAPAFGAPAFGAPAFDAPALGAPAAFAAPTAGPPTFAAPTFAAPTFAAPTFAAPAAPAFDVGLEGPGFDTQAFAQQPVAPPPFAVEASAPIQAAPPVQAFAPAAAVEPAVDPHAFDPHAFDPHAFDPHAFAPPSAAVPPRAAQVASRPGPTPAGPAPITGPHPVLEPAPEIAPLSADDLLELKRKRVEALLSSVPRRADANKTTTASNAKDEKVAAKRPKARPVDADSGLKRLFDEALRDIKQGE